MTRRSASVSTNVFVDSSKKPHISLRFKSIDEDARFKNLFKVPRSIHVIVSGLVPTYFPCMLTIRVLAEFKHSPIAAG